MVFGLSSKSRYVCVDIQFDEVYFTVVRKQGAFFQIDFTEKVVIENGIFEGVRMRTPGKIADVLYEIQKKFGAIPVIAGIPEHFCYATLLPQETYASQIDIQNAIGVLVSVPTYAWTKIFKRNQSSYVSVHVAHKQVCDIFYSLIKNVGLGAVTIYPRPLVLAEVEGVENVLMCDIQKSQTIVSSMHNGSTTHFSVVPYGDAVFTKKIQERFSLDDDERHEVCVAYGTSMLPRKEGHIIHGIAHTFLVPMIDEIHSLVVRQKEYGLPAHNRLLISGKLAQYGGIVDDLERMTRVHVEAMDVWNGVIDFKTYVPSIHKNDSYQYVGIAGLMNILKKGTRYEPFDL